jgi:hypothetical protein
LSKDLNYRLGRYKHKYYLNLILKGSIYILAVLISAFLFLNLIEYQLHLDTAIRTAFFFGYLGICGFVLYKWLFVHLMRLLLKNRQLSDEVAAKHIGRHFPEIDDKLINLVQLSKMQDQSSLLSATINQRSLQMNLIRPLALRKISAT